MAREISRTTGIAIIIGAIGGMLPKIIDIIPKLFANQYPSLGFYIGLGILGGIGALIVFIYKESDLKKALFLGIGAPALLSSVITKTAPTDSSGAALFQLMPSAYAQTVHDPVTIKMILKNQHGRIAQNKLWIKADSKTLPYLTSGDTIHVKLPDNTRELTITYPPFQDHLTVPISQIDAATNTIVLDLNDNSFWHGFYQAFGKTDVPQFKLERTK